MVVAQQDVDFDNIVNLLDNLSAIDLSRLKKILEERWGVQAMAAMAPMMAPQVSGDEEPAKEEATDFKVVLEGFPADKKIAVIRAIRDITGLPLQAVKELVEGAPNTVKDSVPKVEAEEIKKKLTDAGAQVSLVGI